MALNSWHTTHKTWNKINEFLFKNETMSDCAFLFGEGTIRIKIPAHKYVLGGYSPEFYSLFYLMKTDSDEIPITDVSVENFTKFLEFVYTEKTELSLENVGDLIMLAVRYSVESLIHFCGDFLEQSINVENALSLLDKYAVYQLPNFETKCIKTMRQNRKIFEDPLFYEISNGTLTAILKSEELKGFKEITIFKGVDKWSEKNCAINNQVINSDNKRLALGDALKCIRFGAMTTAEFSECTANLENLILTPAELISIFHYISSGGKISCPFSGEKRHNITKMLDLTFQSTCFNKRKLDLDGNVLLFRFTVTKPIKVHGFGILGSADLKNIPNPDQFIIKLVDSGVVLHENVIEIKHDATPKIYDLLFDNSILLVANRMYHVWIQRPEVDNYILNYVLNDCQDQIIYMDDVLFNVKNINGVAAGLIFEKI